MTRQAYVHYLFRSLVVFLTSGFYLSHNHLLELEFFTFHTTVLPFRFLSFHLPLKHFHFFLLCVYN